MFKTYIPLDWIVAVVDQDTSHLEEHEIQEIKDWIKETAQGAESIRFYPPKDKDIENAEYRIFNGLLTEVVKISYNINIL